MIKDHHEGYIGWAEYEQLALNNYGRAVIRVDAQVDPEALARVLDVLERR